MPPTPKTPLPHELGRICELLRAAPSVLLTSHARPDGDSLGSQLALGEALTRLGKQVRIVNSDPAPPLYGFLPHLSSIEVRSSIDPWPGQVVVLECSELSRTGVTGFESGTVLNIDHHLGNSRYGVVNWIDESACACAELVIELIEALGVTLTPEMATNAYVAILTDTGSFRHANITARTFDICRRIAATGVNPAQLAAEIYNNGTMGHLRVAGRLLDRMVLEHDGSIAVLSLDENILNETGCNANDLEGVANLPLAARDVKAVIFLRHADNGLRISLRSKDNIDVRQVATSFGGGGHRNAAGLTIEDPTPDTRQQLIARVAATLPDDRA